MEVEEGWARLRTFMVPIAERFIDEQQFKISWFIQTSQTKGLENSNMSIRKF